MRIMPLTYRKEKDPSGRNGPQRTSVRLTRSSNYNASRRHPQPSGPWTCSWCWWRRREIMAL